MTEKFDKYDFKARQQHEQQERRQKIEEALERVKHKMLVMSGKGGVGKSTVSTNLAVALAQKGFSVGLMDVDLHGPSIPGMLGLAGVKPERAERGIAPQKYMDGLHVISMGAFLPHDDDALIWRGPMKIGAIRQFLADVQWGDLDYLVIDSPPGTGDEPLTVAQEIPGVRAIVVTTPQEVSLADVRKSINFCKKMEMPVIGVIENMSGFACPHCGHVEDLFGKGGGERTASQMGVPFLGAIPLDPALVQSGEAGKPLLVEDRESVAARAYEAIVKKILDAENEPEV